MIEKLDTTKAIATLYRKYLFRSRLEAKWAVFFDLCEWPWSYEPMDFNGWIPDFAIGWRPTLVEVKPFFHESEWEETINKIVQSKCNREVILLGADATKNMEDVLSEAPAIGLLLHPESCDGSVEWACDLLHFGLTEGNGKPGLCPMQGAWENKIWLPVTNVNKWSRVWLGRDEIETELVSRWAHACNAARWISNG